MPDVRLFGTSLATDFVFQTPLPWSPDPAEIEFRMVESPPQPTSWRTARPAYTSEHVWEDGASVVEVHLGGPADVLHVPRAGDFYVEQQRILCHPSLPRADGLIEVRLLGTVMAFWLERQGIPALHASAVAVDGEAVAFLSSHGGGKTTLAAAFLQQGLPLVTDDILPIPLSGDRVLARPGYPCMRMWPELAQHFLDDLTGLSKVIPETPKLRVPVGEGGFGSFLDETLPLRALYLPAVGSPRPTIDELGPADAALAVLGSSFAGPMVESLGWQDQRLRVVARLVEGVPVRRLHIPKSLVELPNVVRAVLDDL